MVVDIDHTDEQVTRFWTKVNLLADVAAVFRADPPIKETFTRVLKLIRDVITFDSATLFLLNKKTGQLNTIISIGEHIDPVGFITGDQGCDFSTWVGEHRKPVSLIDLREPGKPETDGVWAFLVLPLVVEARLIGCITFALRGAGPFREKDVKLLGVVGDQMALSIERLFYQLRLEKKNEALIKAQTDLKRAQNNLINDERLAAVRELAVSINHEINNPLSVIIGNIQYLMHVNKTLSPDTVDRLKKIEAESLRIAEINHRLLEIDELVSETYINGDGKIKMINLHKSAVKGQKHG
ncbi:MAG: GAF domain-containing protein [candidate division Zixibacteria bacterium]|nr:GAF domain-containing protein [candidate division Zixibacteria bacterium]